MASQEQIKAVQDAAKAAAGQAQAALGAAAEKLKGVTPETVTGAVKGGMTAVRASIDAALQSWAKFDADGDGKVTLAETVELLNSKELAEAVTKITGQPHTVRTADDIKKWFGRADWDHSGTLSKREFAVLYAGLQADKAKLGARGLAQSVCHALDRDGDGKIGSTELKKLVAATPLAGLANVIPDGKDVDYKEVFKPATDKEDDA